MKFNMWIPIKTFSKEITVQKKLEGTIVDGYYEPKLSTYKIQGVIANRSDDIWSSQIPGIQDLGEVRLFTQAELQIGDIIDTTYKIVHKQDYYDLFGVYIYRLERSE